MLQKLIEWYGKSTVYGFFALVVLLVGAGIYIYTDSEESPAQVARDMAVRVAPVASLSSGRTLEFIGNVDAVDQTQITTETAGRVVAVYVALGNTVRAGQVIAELENASQRAAVLQAEGAYEAALASAAQGDVSVAEAQNAIVAAQDNAVSVFRNTYNTFRSILLNDVDDIFANPTGQLPGVRIEGGRYTDYLNDERVRFQGVLSDWQLRVAAITRADDPLRELEYARTQLQALAEMLDIVIPQVNDDDSVGYFRPTELQALSRTLTSDRASINATLANIDAALTQYENAEDALARASLGGTEIELSTANAQVKQALGSLRAAQANLEKTILRSSIAGTVNSLSIKTGDFVGPQQVVARVANNNALEVTTFISEAERDLLSIGDTLTLAGRYEGTVTNIAPAVDPDTRKIEVKIAAETNELQNGDTVRITLDAGIPEAVEQSELSIPITALKVETDRTVVFTVNEMNELVAHEVVVGPLMGSNIRIEDGLTSNMEIVIDARGFNEGDTVSLLE